MLVHPIFTGVVALAVGAVAQRLDIQIGNPSGRFQSSINDLVPFRSECYISAYLDAEIYAVPDFNNPPKAIAWALSFLDEYWKTPDGRDMPYPGDFSTETYMHRDGFRVIMMDYEDLPWAVKKWRQENMDKNEWNSKGIAVKDGKAFFAPGVVTWLLPLFAGRDVEPGKNACEGEYWFFRYCFHRLADYHADQLMDLKNYHNGKGNYNSATKFVYTYGGKAEVGNTLRVQAVAEKQVRKE